MKASDLKCPFCGQEADDLGEYCIEDLHGFVGEDSAPGVCGECDSPLIYNLESNGCEFRVSVSAPAGVATPAPTQHVKGDNFLDERKRLWTITRIGGQVVTLRNTAMHLGSISVVELNKKLRMPTGVGWEKLEKLR